MRVAIAIAHAAWKEERKSSLSRLIQHVPEGTPVFASTEPEAATDWARRIWSWVAGREGLDGVAILNDDVDVCPRFADAVLGMVKAAPGEVISLHAVGPDAARLASEGQRWARAYHLTGPGYILNAANARALLAYWGSHPELQYARNVNEDNIASQFAYANQAPFLVALPAIVRHDATVPSTLGYDHHPMRVTSVPWIESDADLYTWPAPVTPPWIPNPWFPIVELERQRRARGAMLQARRDGLCLWCGEGEPVCGSLGTGATICASCIVDTVRGSVAR